MENKKQIEVEIRGPLSYLQLKHLIQKLKKEGRFLSRKKQEVIFFQENKILDLPKDSLRIRKDDNGEKICLKLKRSGSSDQEIEFLLKDGECKKAVGFFKLLGFNCYSISPSLREDYFYRGMTISLKWRCIIGPHFEIEKMVSNKNGVARARESLLSLARRLSLKVWTNKEYLEQKSYYWKLFRRDGHLR